MLDRHGNVHEVMPVPVCVLDCPANAKSRCPRLDLNEHLLSV